MNNLKIELPFARFRTRRQGTRPRAACVFAQVRYDNPALTKDTIAFSCPADVEEEAFRLAVREELANEGDNQQADAVTIARGHHTSAQSETGCMAMLRPEMKMLK